MRGQKVRRANFEFLRIVGIVMIITHHLVVHGTLDVTTTTGGLHQTLEVLALGGKMAVNFFVIMSGYFGVHRAFRLRRFLKLIGQLYGAMCFIWLFLLLMKIPITPDISRSLLFPFHGELWFIQTFLLLDLLTPVLNGLLHSLRLSRLALVVGLLTLILSVLPSFYDWGLPDSALIWFIYLYLLGGTYALTRPNNAQRVMILLLTLGLGLNFYQQVATLGAAYQGRGITDQTSIFMLSFAGAFFVCCDLFPMASHPVITHISSLTLGVYILHEFPPIRTWISQWVNTAQIQANWSLGHVLFFILLRVATIYLVCLILEKCRELLFEPLLDRGIGWFLQQK